MVSSWISDSVLNTSIELVSIVAYVGGIISKLIIDEFSRIRKNQIRKKRNKIEWYEQLSKLSNEIEHTTVSHNKIHELVIDDSVPIEAFYDELSEADQKRYALLDSIGAEEPEEAVQEQLDELSIETKNRIQQRVVQKFDDYFDELNEHFAIHPEDIDEEISKAGANVLAGLLVITLTESVNEEKMNKLNEAAETLASKSDDKIGTLEQSSLNNLK